MGGMNLPLLDSLGIYVSIPFCRSKCTYCNFASGVYPASEHARYVDRLVEEIAGASEDARRRGVMLPSRVDTIYLGGGTPSLLDAALLSRIFDALRGEFAVAGDAEITMECAPGQLPLSVLDSMVEVGVNRVSLGVQSFIDREAAQSGRLHKRSTVLDDLIHLRDAGIFNVNLDLIAGLAGQSDESWAESLGVLVESGVPHASVYMLEVDEDSRLGREILAGGIRYQAALVPNEDAMARMYTQAIETLSAAGLVQYEISNFARGGAESRHNMRYWQRRPYLGIGLDASSLLYEGGDGVCEMGDDTTAPCLMQSSTTASALIRAGSSGRASSLRMTSTSDLAEYMQGGEPVECTRVNASQQLEEAWFLGLRLNSGVQIDHLRVEFGDALVEPSEAIAHRLAETGLLTIEGDQVRLTPQGRLLSNDVFQEFIH